LPEPEPLRCLTSREPSVNRNPKEVIIAIATVNAIESLWDRTHATARDTECPRCGRRVETSSLGDHVEYLHYLSPGLVFPHLQGVFGAAEQLRRPVCFG
jgi:hypothetical protein